MLLQVGWPFQLRISHVCFRKCWKRLCAIWMRHLRLKRHRSLHTCRHSWMPGMDTRTGMEVGMTGTTTTIEMRHAHRRHACRVVHVHLSLSLSLSTHINRSIGIKKNKVATTLFQKDTVPISVP